MAQQKVNINIYKNSRKTKDSQPDYTGYDKNTNTQIACWVKEKDGTKFFSCIISEKEGSGTGSNTPDPKDDLPF